MQWSNRVYLRQAQREIHPEPVSHGWRSVASFNFDVDEKILAEEEAFELPLFG